MSANLKVKTSIVAAAILCYCAASSQPSLSQSFSSPSIRVFATDKTADPAMLTATVDTAAVVDGHIIPMSSVVAECLRDDRAFVVDQMVQDYLVDRECSKRGISISDSEIDNAIASLRKNIAPETLEQQIDEHHSSMQYVRTAFKEKFERERLVEDQVPVAKIVHCREIVIKFASPGMPESIAGTTRNQTDAERIVVQIQGQLKNGKSFSDLADQFSEATPKNPAGDVGMVYAGAQNVDTKIVDVAISLLKGGVYPEPIIVNNSYLLIQAASTSDDHGADEDASFQDAQNAYVQQQTQFIYPQYVVKLIKDARLTFVLDADDIARSGKPLPENAANVDGHNIPMADVVNQCVILDGPESVDRLVENYVVNQEAARRNITVTEAQIDARIATLSKRIAPHTIDEGLRSRHESLSQLRDDFKQEIERSDLVEGSVPPTKIVHARYIRVGFDPNFKTYQKGENERTESSAYALCNSLLHSTKNGSDFENVAHKYWAGSVKDNGGDLGLLYQGMNNMDTDVLDAALGLGKGQTSAKPVKALNSYCIVQTISTDSDHPRQENSSYAACLAEYKTQRTPMLEPDEIVSLIKQSKVTYYIHD